MPHRRSPRSLVLGLALASLVVACGTSPEETTTTTTEVSAAAGSGFCLTWARYQTALSAWLLEPPESLDDAALTATTTRRAGEEASSVAPESLDEPMGVIVSTLASVEDAVAEADSIDDAKTQVAEQLASVDMTTATASATDWVSVSC